jgi:translocation and assembly module TamA
LLLAAVLALAGLPVFGQTTVTGVEGPPLDNILAYLDLTDLDCSASPVTVNQALGRAEEQVAEALQPLGFYGPEVRTSLTSTEDCWQAEVAVQPGEPILLREVDIRLSGEAAERADFQQLRSNSPLVPGARLNHGQYDSLKRGLLDLARSRGFAEARFEESRLDIYPEQLAADISLSFVSGPRYSIGTVTVNQSELDPEFVDAFHELTPGVPFDNRLLTAAFLGLNDSGYFSAVDVRALPADPATLTIPVQIDLTLSPRRYVSYGVGVSTDTGPRLRFGRTVRRFNRQGHQLSIDARLSPVVSELTTVYRMPYGDPRFDWLNFSLGAKREETDTALARSIEAGVRRIVDRSRGWSRTTFLNYVFEDFEVGSQKGRPKLLIPGVDWTRIRGDDALRPANGSKVVGEVRGASDALLSDTGFIQATVGMKWIHSMSPHGRVLLRGRGGYMVEDDFSALPPSIRYFAGGDLSIRGFDFQSLGPVDQDGAVIGGDRLIELSAEYEHDIKPRWSLAMFVDSGNAFDERGLDMRTGAGIGARWRSPVGPVRIDIAWPVNDIETGAQLHLTLGPDL